LAASTGGIRVHDGILRALDLAEARPEVALGLGTGNMREGARIKLGHAGIYHRFSFGGFGDDSIDRPAILAAGARRGAAQLGLLLPDCRVVVVGDTPKDIAAAQAIGADCVAVATGMHSVAELEAHRPTLACQNLNDQRADAVLFGDECAPGGSVWTVTRPKFGIWLRRYCSMRSVKACASLMDVAAARVQ
jgi:phosphoglycolate phosphatase-like HAD superfamily hydrolase